VVIATPAAIRSAGIGRGGPRRVENLAERIPAEVISGHSRRDGAAWQLAVGLLHSDLSAATVTLYPGDHLVITGGPASGRTTTLRTLAGALRDSGPADVRVLTSRPDEWSSHDQVLIGAEALTDPIRQPTLVLVDGVEAASAADATLSALVNDPLVRIVVADRIDAFRLPAVWLRGVLASRAGILLQPQPDHGDLLRVRLPMRNPVAHPPGRGYLVENGFAELIQVVLPADCSTSSASPPARQTTASVAACTTTAATMHTTMNP
jgi:DNA segregation ATPase FtsK/SpoIIIE, S-DNA-T family